MFGFAYSIKEHFTFSRKEFIELFWTSLAFAFILSFRKWGVGKQVDVGAGLLNLFLALLFVLAAMLIHVCCQKIVAIKLGYKATYSYWLNGIFLSMLLVFMSVGFIVFILPGAVLIEHIPQLRLGKFRYGTNLKDVARVALAGPISHILAVMFAGVFYFVFGKNEWIFVFMVVNLFLAVYSMLPIPKIDIPTKMDSGSDGLGMFFFSRTLYVLVLVTIIVFVGLVFVASTYAALWWMFILAFIIGCIVSGIYSITLEQKN